MRQFPRKFVVIALLGFVSACNTLPQNTVVIGAHITPSELGPGDSATMSVELQDPLSRVRQVQGIIKQDPSLIFNFKDDGISPDRVAGDGIWTIQVDVPFNAPPGDFEFEIIAYDSDGEVVVIHDENNEAAPLSMSFGLVIEYPKDDEE